LDANFLLAAAAVVAVVAAVQETTTLQYVQRPMNKLDLEKKKLYRNKFHLFRLLFDVATAKHSLSL